MAQTTMNQESTRCSDPFSFSSDRNILTDFDNIRLAPFTGMDLKGSSLFSIPIGCEDDRPYPNSSDDPDTLPLNASDVENAVHSRSLREYSAEMFKAYQELDISGASIWEDFITAFRPHTIRSMGRSMLTEWIILLKERSVYVVERKGISKQRALIELLYREDHVGTTWHYSKKWQEEHLRTMDQELAATKRENIQKRVSNSSLEKRLQIAGRRKMELNDISDVDGGKVGTDADLEDMDEDELLYLSEEVHGAAEDMAAPKQVVRRQHSSGEQGWTARLESETVENSIYNGGDHMYDDVQSSMTPAPSH